MRFQSYLNESPDISIKDAYEIMDMIKKDCQPFLRSRDKGQFLWRGSEKQVDSYKKLTPRTDRKPKDMFQERHEKLDKAFDKIFGWKARSQGVFCYGSPTYAESYGEPFLVFPIGKFKFLWSPTIKDLYVQIGELLNYKNFSYEEIVKKFYQEKNLKEAIDKKSNEIIIGCKSYYLVNHEFYRPFDLEIEDQYLKDLEDL